MVVLFEHLENIAEEKEKRKRKESAYSPRCTPACFSRIQHDNTQSFGSCIFGQKSRSRCASDTGTDDNDVRLGREMCGGSVA